MKKIILLWTLINLLVNLQVNCISQEWISYDGGRTYYYGLPNQINEQPPPLFDSNKTITDYEILTSFETQFMGVNDISGDADHDGNIELYFRKQTAQGFSIFVYEFDGDLNYTITDLGIDGIVWDIGDINNNGLIDILVQYGDSDPGTNGYLRVYESLNIGTLPNNLIHEVILPNCKSSAKSLPVKV
jgi:hypothetical protein